MAFCCGGFYPVDLIPQQYPQYPRVETRGYIDKTRLRGFGWWVGAIFFNVIYVHVLKPAQAGFVCVAIGFNLWRFGVVGFLVPTGWGTHNTHGLKPVAT